MMVDIPFSEFVLKYPDIAASISEEIPLEFFLADGRYRVKVYDDNISIYLDEMGA